MAEQAVPGAATIVALPADIDIGNADHAYDQLYAAFAAGAPMVIADFTATTFCDTASLRRLVAVQRRAVARNAQLRLAAPPGNPVRQVLEITGLDQLLPVYPSARHAAADWIAPPDPARPARPGSPPRTAVDRSPGTRDAGRPPGADRPAAASAPTPAAGQIIRLARVAGELAVVNGVHRRIRSAPPLKLQSPGPHLFGRCSRGRVCGRAGIRIAWPGGCGAVRRRWCGSARSSCPRT